MHPSVFNFNDDRKFSAWIDCMILLCRNKMGAALLPDAAFGIFPRCSIVPRHPLICRITSARSIRRRWAYITKLCCVMFSCYFPLYVIIVAFFLQKLFLCWPEDLQISTHCFFTLGKELCCWCLKREKIN